MLIKYPKISIITPVYNRENLVRETIDSILDQNYPNLEYIVVEDGSTDDSLNVIKKYGNKIKIISQKNQGETKAVNKGLRLATGKYIGIVNSDDPLLPGSLMVLKEVLEKNPNVLVVYPDILHINENSEKTGIGRVHAFNYKYMLEKQHCIVGQGAFFRKEAVKLIGLRDEQFKYVADFDFWLRLGLYGKFKKIPKVLASGRFHSGSQSLNIDEEDIVDEHLRLVRKTFANEIIKKKFMKLKNNAFSQAYINASFMYSSPIKIIFSYLMAFYYSPLYFLRNLRSIGRENKNRIKRHINNL